MAKGPVLDNKRRDLRFAVTQEQDVSVNRILWGSTPVTLTVMPGNYTFEFRYPGYVTYKETFFIRSSGS